MSGVKTTLKDLPFALPALYLVSDIAKEVVKSIGVNENVITRCITESIEKDVDNVILIRTLQQKANRHVDLMVSTLGESLTLRIINFEC